VEDFLPLTAPVGNKVSASVSAAKLDFRVSPNPSTGYFELRFDEDFSTLLAVTVVDLMGRTVYQGHIEPNPSAALDLSHLQSGVYFVMVKSGDHLAGSQKVEIQR
jgi:hypothetical protein